MNDGGIFVGTMVLTRSLGLWICLSEACSPTTPDAPPSVWMEAPRGPTMVQWGDLVHAKAREWPDLESRLHTSLNDASTETRFEAFNTSELATQFQSGEVGYRLLQLSNDTASVAGHVVAGDAGFHEIVNEAYVYELQEELYFELMKWHEADLSMSTTAVSYLSKSTILIEAAESVTAGVLGRAIGSANSAGFSRACLVGGRSLATPVMSDSVVAFATCLCVAPYCVWPDVIPASSPNVVEVIMCPESLFWRHSAVPSFGGSWSSNTLAASVEWTRSDRSAVDVIVASFAPARPVIWVAVHPDVRMRWLAPTLSELAFHAADTGVADRKLAVWSFARSFGAAGICR